MTYKITPYLILIFLFVITINGLGQTNSLEYLTILKDKKDFDLLKGKPLSANYNGIECVKIVYVLQTKTLYYIQSVKHTWHYSFTNRVLHDEDDLNYFNTINYGENVDRKYILATFNYNTNSKNYFLQFAPPDNVSDELISTLTIKIAQTFYKQNQFKILLNTTTLLRRKKELAKKFNTITSDELYKSQKYQPIYKGKTSGVLTFIDADSINPAFDYSNHILVINGNSNTIPICKGVITNQFQTPLSHICLLTLNRKTPCAYLKNAFENDSLKKLNHQSVEINISVSELLYKSISSITSTTKLSKVISLQMDTVSKQIHYLKLLNYKNRKTYGSKACNLAELKKMEAKQMGITTPPNAFAIPFYYYYQHLKTHGITSKIDTFLSHRKKMPNDSLLTKELKAIRKLITNSKIDSLLLLNISNMCVKHLALQD